MIDDNFLWWRDGVIYQIYPRSFADSNADGLGDLNGIRQKLDYLSQLGIQAIWLSPIYPSPDADFGYDIRDYQAIDPRFGTLEEFDAFVGEAHQRGIRIILDMVFNHTSNQHPWFLASKSSRENPYRDWYIWRAPGARGKKPNNWQSVFGGPGWEYDPQTGEYYFHMFLKEQPDLNWRNPAVRQAVLAVVRFWLDRGVDGFRLDVFNAYFKDTSLRDNPPAIGIRGFDRQKHVHDINQPELMDFLRELRALVDSYPERYLVGETFVGNGQTAAEYCGPQRLHAAFNFAFTNGPWNPVRFLNAVLQWEKLLGKENWPNYVLNNHDLVRSASRYTRNEDDVKLKVAAAMLLTLRGTPFLYYGEEIGMRDIALSRDQILDPPGRKYWPFFKGRDGCRSPMQWDSSAWGGFSTIKPWLPVHPDAGRRNTAAQDQDPRSLLNFYRQIIALRRSTPALYKGEFNPQVALPGGLLVYLRETEEDAALIILNFSPQKQDYNGSVELSARLWRTLFGTHRAEGSETPINRLSVDPYEVLILARR